MNDEKVTQLRPITQDQNIANYISQVLTAPSLSIPASEVDRLVASRAWLARIATGELVVMPKPSPEVRKAVAEAMAGAAAPAPVDGNGAPVVVGPGAVGAPLAAGADPA
jgi:hypothetical protein